MTKIYTLTHKDFTPPSDKIYVPLSVFEKNGKNIADKNCYYSELTGCYFAWKNSDADIVGIAHYRRYLLDDDGKFYNEKGIQKALVEYDLITPKVLTLDFPYEYGFSKNHKPYYLKELRKLLCDSYEDVLDTYDTLVKGVNTLFSNMLICKRELFCDYHEWLFSILFDLEKRITIDEPDSYHRRIFGFISEFLMYVYIIKNNLKIKQSMVGMVGEKSEVRQVKAGMWEYLSKFDYSRAKEYFLSEYEKRPDLLMEASDVGWELHYLMEAVLVCEFEADAAKELFLKRISGYEELLSYLRNLNGYIKKKEKAKYFFSDEAIHVANTLFSGVEKKSLF